MNKKYRPSQRLQLFNPSHRNDVLKLLGDATFLDLNGDKDQNVKESEDQNEDYNNLEDLLDEPSSQEEPLINNEDQPGGVQEVKGLACSTCEITFVNVIDQRQHFRLDLHRYNLKRKSHNQKPVDDEQFDEMMDGLSSISGSDGEDSQVIDKPLSRLIEKVTLDEIDKADVIASKTRTRCSLKNSPKKFFQSSNNEAFSVYQAILYPIPTPTQTKDDDDANKCQPINCLLEGVQNRKTSYWGFIMSSGGHFAGAIFDGSTEVIHKTFHSYTVRAKQGGSQSSRDGKSATSHIKSAGASLRRYNEQSFNQHVQELLASWKEKLSQCQFIFYRAVSHNQNILFGGQNPPLDKKDSRLKNIPFPTKRPTFSEVKRVLSVLSTIEVYGDAEEFRAIVTKPNKHKDEDAEVVEQRSRSKQKNNIDRAKSRSPPKRDIPEGPPSSPEPDNNVEYELVETMETIDLRNDLEEFGDSLNDQERKKKPKNKKAKPKGEEFVKPVGTLGDLLASIVEKNEDLAKDLISKLQSEFTNENGDLSLWNQIVDAQSSTLLHFAAKNDLKNILWLLMQNGCDPSTKDKAGKYPYNWAPTKDCRKVFMRFQAENPEKYNYSLAQIPGPLTKEMEEEKSEKQKIFNRLKREKEKLKKQEKHEKKQELDEQERFLHLSDREKRALAAERRILGQAKRNGEVKPILIRCFECATDITGKVPFEYAQNVFCTTKCLTAHRKKFPVPLSV